MHFWVLVLILTIWWPSHLKSNSVKQAENKGLNFDDAQNTSLENPETIEELTSNLFGDEGDIIQQLDRNAVPHRWATKEIPFVVDELIRHRTKDILNATKMISRSTCLTFAPRKNENDYLFFTKGRGCASYVGCIGGKQPVYIGPRCIVGNIVHEILHALGFLHEHTRLDRDDYIKVLFENIRDAYKKNFKKKKSDTRNIPYDLQSIMHYGGYYFSSNKRRTIRPLQATQGMGQRTRLTKLDIDMIMALYC